MTLQVSTVIYTWSILNAFYPDGTIGAKKKQDMTMINDAIDLLQMGLSVDDIINLYLKSYEEV